MGGLVVVGHCVCCDVVQGCLTLGPSLSWCSLLSLSRDPPLRSYGVVSAPLLPSHCSPFSVRSQASAELGWGATVTVPHCVHSENTP